MLRPTDVASSLALPLALLLAPCPGDATQSAPDRYFRIRVVDAETGRGVPLVELRTVNEVLYVTDNAGVVAVNEPGLMGREVWFHVRSHGYELPADGFGYRGFRAVLEPGGSITVELRRQNVAERFYRITGQGLYRDSVLLGDQPPVRAPLLNGGVLGQDSVVNAVYGGQLYWFWGDTNRVSYPLGNFAVSGAVSELPHRGGLDPSVGVDLRYFVGEDGFSRRMCPIPGPGPVWIGGLSVLADGGLADGGREQMVCHYARMESLGVRHEHGIAVWNDGTETFEKRAELPLDAKLHPAGHPLRVGIDGEDWLYFPNPYPAVRVRAKLADVLQPERYEAFTCLRAGARWDEREPDVERNAGGRLVWSWKADTAVITPARWEELVKDGDAEADEGWLDLTDVETGERVRAHGGSVYWNAHRRKWVMIALQTWGRSMLGEVWFAEADSLAGSWAYARRVVTHDHYSFYNVKQHPYFDQEDGRFVYFEGTYTAMFSGNEEKTPRYDYNQVVYRLDLEDPRLCLPAPVYRVAGDGTSGWGTGAAVATAESGKTAREIPFFALPVDRAREGSVPVLQQVDPDGRTTRLTTGTGGTVVFHALPATGPLDPAARSVVARVHEWTHRETGGRDYRVAGEEPPGDGWQRSPEPVFRAWRNPSPRGPFPRGPRALPRDR